MFSANVQNRLMVINIMSTIYIVTNVGKPNSENMSLVA